MIGRGIDVSQVGIVLNYNVPVKTETFVHRVGRCGRNGKRGISITLITDSDTTAYYNLVKEIDVTPLPLIENINKFL